MGWIWPNSNTKSGPLRAAGCLYLVGIQVTYTVQWREDGIQYLISGLSQHGCLGATGSRRNDRKPDTPDCPGAPDYSAAIAVLPGARLLQRSTTITWHGVLDVLLPVFFFQAPNYVCDAASIVRAERNGYLDSEWQGGKYLCLFPARTTYVDTLRTIPGCISGSTPPCLDATTLHGRLPGHAGGCKPMAKQRCHTCTPHHSPWCVRHGYASRTELPTAQSRAHRVHLPMLGLLSVL